MVVARVSWLECRAEGIVFFRRRQRGRIGAVAGIGRGLAVGVCRDALGGGFRRAAACEKGFRIKQYLARAGAAGRADHSAFLQQVDKPCGVVVAYAHAPLKVRSGSAFRGLEDFKRAPVQNVLLALGHA